MLFCSVMYFLRRNIAVTNWKELNHIADNILYVLCNGRLEKKGKEKRRRREKQREKGKEVL